MFDHESGLRSLVCELASASDSDDVATLLLKTALSAAASALDQSEWSTRGRVARGVVHIRPDESYRRLIGTEHLTAERVDDMDCATLAVAWRWIVERQCQVSIDVQRGTVHAWLGTSRQTVRRANGPGDVMENSATRNNLVGRGVTHVFVTPLCGVGFEPSGMLAIEACCRDAIGREFIWPDIAEFLSNIAVIATPHLLGLPSGSVAPPGPDSLLPVVGRTMAPIVELLRIFSKQEETLLLGGPTGVGKSRLARWCHAHSPRHGEPFETLDLISVPEELQMAELFGWKRGAFTGAVRDTSGAIARAGCGTLFIDEIDKLSLRAQAGLLRVLEERVYRPIGDEAGEHRAQARFIVGSNGNLRALVQAGHFREDLYYRINVLPVRIPALDDRRGEVRMWAEYMLARRHQETEPSGGSELTSEAAALLDAHPWPGNLRQLDNVIRRAYTFASAEAGTTSLLALAGRHVARALEHERHDDGVEEGGSFVGDLWRAAVSFATEAERRHLNNQILPLEWADALKGMILAATATRFRGSSDGLMALGQAQMIRGRNHHRLLRRELERVRSLLCSLDIRDIPDDLRHTLDTQSSAGPTSDSLCHESRSTPAGARHS